MKKVFNFFKNSNETKEKKFVEVGNNKFFRNFKKITLTLYVLLLIISYYIALVPINLKSVEFYGYATVMLFVLTFIFFLDSFFNDKSKVIYKTLLKIIIVMIVITTLSNLYSSPILQAKRYASLVKKQISVFEDDIKQADFAKLPVVDRDTAIKLGARKMGEMGDLVSQYNIDETYSQIALGEKPVRVTPLVYADFVKWFLNRDKGIPYYIKIDMVTQNASLVKLDEPIMYSMSDKFSRNLYRHIRFSYPTAIIDDINFETDDDGKPYFIATAVEPTIGLFGAPDTKYIIIVDAHNGKMEKYNVGNVPEWVDRVYPANMIITQLDDNGKFERGFLNSKIKQEGVTKTTDGYNYLISGSDISLYTGITSVLADESNIGFVIVNMRTKETKFYPVSSAEEFSVMDSAKGAVQEKGYNATFPLLINVYNRPTYFMSLKDKASLIKMYSLVDAQNYQKVAVGNTVEETVENYQKITSDIMNNVGSSSEKTIVIEDIQSVVLDGNTLYYIKAKDEEKILSASINIDPRLAFVKIGDTIEVSGSDMGNVFIVTKLK
ncbi:hypothetical protein HMPREF0379_0739 [[Eubacterium] yurii subsp. margaretiae ATCC 43715]|nr:hypothetical protein HMPREF0379_0739 [[Eubacterium] yurii subsp. margaretiae ATCC 43715]